MMPDVICREIVLLGCGVEGFAGLAASELVSLSVSSHSWCFGGKYVGGWYFVRCLVREASG